eukprot:UN10058
MFETRSRKSYLQHYRLKSTLKLPQNFDKMLHNETNFKWDPVLGSNSKNRGAMFHSNCHCIYRWSRIGHGFPSQKPEVGLQKLWDIVENVVGKKFNCCLANYYGDKNACVGFHADDEFLFEIMKLKLLRYQSLKSDFSVLKKRRSKKLNS